MYQHLMSFTLQLIRLSVWLVLLMIVFVPLERIFSHRKQKVFRQSCWLDLTYYFIGGILPKLLLILPMTIVAAIFHHLVPLRFYESVTAMPLWLRMIAAMIVGETGAYWGHRWSHENAFLWRFHAIHHSAEDIDWLVSTRAHPVDHFFTRFCMLVPDVRLGPGAAHGHPRRYGFDDRHRPGYLLGLLRSRQCELAVRLDGVVTSHPRLSPLAPHQ